ncbi:hypothetical protein CCR94_14460 [Rhodoblastus sphagnicola]|uniref:Uncharacterized protein n=1 Tax=Rhodoblastus sphagnicola TaxID=333368 RepID=A0A2S6N5F2_9HYPH|nr:hypothetical protein [Rhodoblastus sphagnicola]MBB4197232.1 hypothetical protein [Rhodoblastus sphagnicola]PPQ29841.1 hypothetical protein CCR94_14460 [Rhodoblastus sphagnicola]
MIDNQYGIGFAIHDGVDPRAIRRNEIIGSKKAGVVALLRDRMVSGDLSAPGAARVYRDVDISDNLIS